ncbi:hydroxyacid dehydrogenase [Microbacterium hibisci]|uniref:hydroxyacid dehydrogenase n=1 Tax=Microbacterium hibisci TaxID=2036000 RepID=UPI001EF37921|nr:hydroxyacid dehydrogenase [Microbacterium hibisci]
MAMTSTRPHALVAMGADAFADLFDPPRLSTLRATATIDDPLRVDDLTAPQTLPRLREAEILITGWGGPRLGPELLSMAPRLRAVLHAGGSVKGHVSPAFWEAGVLVTSAADANAVPVAEYTLAMILLEAKRAPSYIEGYARSRDVAGAWRRDIPPALGFGGTVGIVGLSRVGRRVADLLRPFDLRVLVADPLQDERSAALAGARLTSLDDLLAESDIVTLHAPELPETRHLIDARRMALLRPHSVIINTARGSLVDTEALIARCRTGTLRAILDVTDPEPLPSHSPLFTTPGVVMSPHIAGAMHAETHRLADAVLEELRRVAQGQPPRHRIDRASLGFIA